MALVWVRVEPSLALSIKTTWKGERKHYGEIDYHCMQCDLALLWQLCIHLCMIVGCSVEQTSLSVNFFVQAECLERLKI